MGGHLGVQKSSNTPPTPGRDIGGFEGAKNFHFFYFFYFFSFSFLGPPARRPCRLIVFYKIVTKKMSEFSREFNDFRKLKKVMNSLVSIPHNLFWGPFGGQKSR